MITQSVIISDTPQQILSIPQILDQPQSSAPKSQILGHIKFTFQRNPDKTNEIVAQQISSFILQSIENPPLHNPNDEEYEHANYEDLVEFDQVESLAPNQEMVENIESVEASEIVEIPEMV